MPSPQVFYTAVGIAKESSWGTDLAPTIWLPVMNPRFDPGGLQHILDDGLRGQASEDYDLLPGPGNGSFNWNGNLYLDSVPALFSSAIGPDVISGAGPYVHTFALSPTPDSYTVEEQQNVQPYHYNGGRVSELTINFNAGSGAVGYTVQGVSKVGAESTATTQAFTLESAISAVAGWQGSITVAAGATAVLTEGSITLARGTKILHGMTNTPAGGTQDARQIYPLALRATMRLTFDYSQTSEFYLAYPKSGGSLAGGAVTKNAVVITLQRSANEKVVITMTKAGWRQAQRENADGTYTSIVEINGIHNATDVGPLKVAVTNGRATAY